MIPLCPGDPHLPGVGQGGRGYALLQQQGGTHPPLPHQHCRVHRFFPAGWGSALFFAPFPAQIVFGSSASSKGLNSQKSII
jgi:hypothetical protein